MAKVEDRIVRMEFDNAAFERRLESTLRGLSQLNKAMQFPTAGKGLTDISNAARGFNLSGMASAIESVSTKFLALSTIGITVLSNLVTAAMRAGTQIVKSLALDPVMDGFREYELQIGSIQTILSNTKKDGTNLEQVSAALDELNAYADQTIYNFAEMTRNIGYFSAAGVDLDTSVRSIKGIANLAAISGSSSEQASTAMYQLSQAISNGTVRLMDWNSVVNAGMGGQVFQEALFETAKMMGTIEDVPMDQTFDQWTEAGNSFRDSLEEGWLTADVLTTTLEGFTGELTEAQLQALGYTQEQARYFAELGTTGVEAATKVRTLTQLMQTTKEAISSGWAQSFRIVVGDFEQATELFTMISDRLSGWIGRQADARNELLQGWADSGGRTKLIWAVWGAFRALGQIMRPIQQAFREVFPKMTSERLLELTTGLQRLAVAMKPSEKTVGNLRRIFRGLFTALKIGWTVIKEGVKFFKDLIVSMTGLGGGGFLSFLADLIGPISNLKRTLVDNGGIADFFDNLREGLQTPLAYLQKFKDLIGSLFDNFKIPNGLGDLLGSIGESLGSIFGRGADIGGDALSGIGGMWNPLRNAMRGVADILDEAWDTLSDWFSGLGDKLADVFSAPDFDSVLDVIDTGLLGGIVALLAKLVSGGLSFDFGGGFFDNLSGTLGELNGTLEAMQTNLKADALMKIATAIGILVGSIVILSFIDPDKTADALATIAIGMGQLIGAFVILEKTGIGPRAAATMNLIATSLILLSGAVITLSLAMLLISTMSWEELSKGLVGVAAGLALLVGSAILLSRFSGSLVGTGIGMLAIAGSMILLAGAVKLFSMMDWGELGKGLAAMAGALVAIGLAVNLMPATMPLIGLGLLLVGAALNVIALAMKQFASLEWGQIAKGLVAIVGALAAIALTTALMSPTLPLAGAGLILVSIALGRITGVLKDLGGMSWGEIAKGLTAMAAALAAIVLAMTLAQGGALGAAGIIGMAFALTVLVQVMKEVAEMSWGEIIKGVGGIAIVLGVLGVAAALLTPVIGPLLALGAALLLIGGAFALFGVGVMSVAKAFELLARVGKKGVETLIDALGEFASALPGFLTKAAESILEFIQSLTDGLPEIIDGLVEIASALLDGLIELTPKAGEAIRSILGELIKIAREYFPDFVQLGMDLIIGFLTGVRDNIAEITTLVADIIINFLDALALKIPEVIDSVYNFVVAVIEGVVAKLVDIGALFIPKALEIIEGLIQGLDENKGKILDWFIALPGNIIEALGNAGSWLLEKGAELISGMWEGITGFVTETLIPWFTSLPGLVISWIPNVWETLKDKGSKIINGFYNGIVAFVNRWVIPFFTSLPGKIVGWIGNTWETLKDKGSKIINGFYNGIVAFVNQWVIPFFTGLTGKILGWVGNTWETLKDKGTKLIQGLWNGIVAVWNDKIVGFFPNLGQKILNLVGNLWSLLYDVGWDIIDGFWQGMKDLWGSVTGWIEDRLDAIPGPIKSILGIDSPSKVFAELGRWTMEGFAVGLEDGWEKTEKFMRHLDPKRDMATFSQKMQNVLAGAVDQINGMEEFNPTITPVLDLSQVQSGARALAGMLPTDGTYLQASSIARSTTQSDSASTTESTPAPTVKFEQNNYSPTALSTNDIYKNTRNQIATAKEKLSIP